MARLDRAPKEWVVSRRMMTWAWLGFVLGIVYFVWFVVVLAGEQEGWTDNPGAWAGLPTDLWGYVGLAVFAVTGLLFLALLVRREVPARTFTFDDEGRYVGATQAYAPPAPPTEGSPPATQ